MPIDLGQMISYLDKRYHKNLIKSDIKMDKMADMNGMSNYDVERLCHQELSKFIQLFDFKENKLLESQLRKKHHLT